MKKMKKTMMFVALFVVTIAVHAQSLNGKTFKIQSAAPNSKGKVIDADGYTLGKNGTKIQLWDMNGASHQNWQFQFAGRGANNYYIISMSPRAGKFNFLEASGGHLANNGGIVQLWENNLGGKNQLWKVTKNSDGNYRIVTTGKKADFIQYEYHIRLRAGQDATALVADLQENAGLQTIKLEFKDTESLV